MISASASLKPSTEPAAAAGSVTTTTDPSTGAVSVTPTTPDEQKAERPTWLPEKFKSAEDMAKAYTELEKKQSTATPAATTHEQTTEQVRKAAADAGINMDALNTEFSSKGALSEETLKSLEAKGIKREVISSYIEGQKALNAKFGESLNAEVGGPENYTNMISWAKANLTAVEISAFDSAIATGNAEIAKLVVRGLNAKYADAVGSDPSLVTGNGVPTTTGVKPFADSGEVMSAMQDKRYKTSSSYRAEVQNRLAISDLFA